MQNIPKHIISTQVNIESTRSNSSALNSLKSGLILLRNSPVQFKNTTAQKTKITATFHGKHHDEGWRLKLNGRNAIIYGEGSELTPTKVVDGEQKYSKKSVGKSIGFIKGEVGEVKIVANCVSSQKLYGFIGQLKYCLPTKSAPVQAVVIAPIVSTAVSIQPLELAQQPNSKEVCITSPDLKSEKEQKKIARLTREDKVFERLSITVKAELAAGQDPLIPLSYFSRVSKRSRATLYRELGTVIPKVIKISKSSFLLHSDLENYMAGRPAALRNQSENEHSSTTVGLVQQAA
jgi:hypothetical protein